MTPIKPSDARFIKLGKSGSWEIEGRSGQRAFDIDDSRRDSVLTVLRRQKVPEHWVQMVEEVAELEADEQSQMFGEALPKGLRLR